MNAVRMEYKEEFEKLPRGERGLFWVLDATLPPMPKKEKAKQATLNIFSVRLCVKNVHAVNLACDSLHPPSTLIPCVSHPHVIFVAGRQYGYIRRCK